MLWKVLIAVAVIVVGLVRGTNIAEFTFEPRGEQTAVTWTMTGQKNFLAKAIQLFMSMDKMIGGAFEQGLAQLKAVVERSRR